MANWVLDEWVLACAANEHHDDCMNAITLLQLIQDYHKVVFDFEGILEGKYQRFFNASKLLRVWYANLIKRVGRIERRTSRLNTAINTKLDEISFDPDDRCFIAVAMNADKLIVSEDGDFYEEKASEYFREIGLEVLRVKEAKDAEAGMR